MQTHAPPLRHEIFGNLIYYQRMVGKLHCMYSTTHGLKCFSQKLSEITKEGLTYSSFTVSCHSHFHPYALGSPSLLRKSCFWLRFWLFRRLAAASANHSYSGIPGKVGAHKNHAEFYPHSTGGKEGHPPGGGGLREGGSSCTGVRPRGNMYTPVDCSLSAFAFSSCTLAFAFFSLSFWCFFHLSSHSSMLGSCTSVWVLNALCSAVDHTNRTTKP